MVPRSKICWWAGVQGCRVVASSVTHKESNADAASAWTPRHSLYANVHARPDDGSCSVKLDEDVRSRSCARSKSLN